MTNEEFKRVAQALYDNIGPDFGEQIEKTLRDVAAKAYDEAIEAASSLRLSGLPAFGGSPEEARVMMGTRNHTVDTIVARIETLKQGLG